MTWSATARGAALGAAQTATPIESSDASARRYWELAGIGLLVVATGGGWWILRSRRPEEPEAEEPEEGPFLVFPPPRGVPVEARSVTATPIVGIAPDRPGPMAWSRLTPVAASSHPAGRSRGSADAARTDRAGSAMAVARASRLAAADDAPETARIEFLPGRLEVVAGPEPGLEFRFVRSAGTPPHVVTLGREPGPTGRHVRLAAPTVSRLHARMRFEKQQWLIENHSTTNPVRVNDQAIPAGGAYRVLVDGDLIRLGEVVLRYRRIPS